MAETATGDGASVRVANPRVRRTVVQDNGIWQTLVGHEGQYVVVDVTTGGDVSERLSRMEMESVVDGEALDDGTPVLVVEGGPGNAPRDPPEWERRHIAFPFPTERHDSAAVQWQTGDSTVRWNLSEGVRETLAAAPGFHVKEPVAERRGDGVVVDLTVRNRGDRDGRFQALVSFDSIHDASSIVAVDVPASGSSGYEGTPPILDYFEHGTVTVSFHGADGMTRRELDVPEP
jgi:hypothetical protein